MTTPTDPDEFTDWLASMHRQLDWLMVLLVPVELLVLAVEIHFLLAVLVALVIVIAICTDQFRRHRRNSDRDAR